MSLNQAYTPSLSSLNWIPHDAPRLMPGSHDASRRKLGSPGAPGVAIGTRKSILDSGLMRFVEIVMKCCGLQHNAGRSKSRSIPLTIYSSFVLLVSCFNLVRAAVTIFDVKPETLGKVPVSSLFLVWYITGTLTLVIFFVSSVKKRGVRRFNHVVAELSAALQAKRVQPMLMRRASKADVVIVTVVTSASTLACVGYAVFALMDDVHHAENWSWLTKLFMSSQEDFINWIGRIVTLLASIYGVLVCLWPTAYILMLSKIVGQAYDDLTTHLLLGFARDIKVAEFDLVQQRRLHLQVHSLVSYLDRNLARHVLGLHHLSAVVSVILATYALWHSPVGRHLALTLVLSSAVFLSVWTLWIELISVAAINDKARKCGEVLLEFVTDRMESSVKVQLFLSQLHMSRGFTGFGLYAIKRSTIVKVMTFLLAYLLLLVTGRP